MPTDSIDIDRRPSTTKVQIDRIWKGFRSSVSTRPADEIDGDAVVDLDHRDPNALKPLLPAWQIFSLAISGIIGMTVWNGTGLGLSVAGPAGLLTAIGFVGVTCIAVMESLSEMIILWPVAMGFYEYVRAFVDHDLAVVVALAYWYAWSSVFGVLLVAAANLSTYWSSFAESQMWQTLLFYIVCPIFMLVINCLGVAYYGWLEGIGGVLKLVFCTVGIIYLFYTSGQTGSQYFNEQYKFDGINASNTFTAVCLVIPPLTYGFLGVESITTTAFEAKNRNALRFPSRYIAYVVTAIYFLSAIGQAHSVWWDNPALPSPGKRAEPQPDLPITHSTIVLAAQAQGQLGWADFFNGALIFFCLSSSNTALYISSRTLYGLTRSIGVRDSKWYVRWLGVLGTTTPASRVPGWALLVSAVAFCWLPFLHLREGYSSQDVLTIFSTIGSVGVVIVWASICLAYIRCWLWFRHHAKRGDLPQRYDRWRNGWDGSYMATFSYLQPFPAAIGLLCSFLIIFIFSTATFWNSKANFRKVATAFAGPIILCIFYIGLKIRNKRWWVELHPVYTGPLGLSEVLNRLERSAQTETNATMEAQELEEVEEVDDAPGVVRFNAV